MERGPDYSHVCPEKATLVGGSHMGAEGKAGAKGDLELGKPQCHLPHKGPEAQA